MPEKRSPSQGVALGALPLLTPSDGRLTYSVNDACRALGIGRTRLYEIMPELDVRRLGGRTLIMADSLRDYVAGLPKVAIRPADGASAPKTAAQQAA